MAPPLAAQRIPTSSLGTRSTGCRRWWPTGTTTTTAFGTVAAKADIVQVHDGIRLCGAGPATSVADGRFVLGTPQFSIGKIKIASDGADNATGDWRLWLWEPQIDAHNTPGVAPIIQWNPVLLATGTFTLGAKTGVAGGLFDANYRYADTIVISTDRGLPTLGTRVMMPAAADESPAILVFDPVSDVCIVEIEVRRNSIASTKLINGTVEWCTSS